MANLTPTPGWDSVPAIALNAPGHPDTFNPSYQALLNRTAYLETTAGAAKIGATDGASGSLWTTVQGFISRLTSSVGGSIGGVTLSAGRTSSTYTTTDATAGTEVADNRVINVDGAGVQKVHIAQSGQIFVNADNYTGDGHAVGSMGFVIQDGGAGSNSPLLIGTEGKTQVTTGDVEALLAVHAGLADVAAGSTVDIWVGNHSSIVDIKGAVTNAVGFAFGPLKVTGSIDTVAGLYMLPPVVSPGTIEGSGTIGQIVFSHMPSIPASRCANQYAFSSAMTYEAGANKWNINCTGTAPSRHVGPMVLGANALSGADILQVTGNAKVTGNAAVAGNLTANSVRVTTPVALGYGAGTNAGGTVTQATSKSTAVTLNKPTGKIVLNNASLAAGAVVGFTFNNSLLEADDVLAISPTNAVAGTAANYIIQAGVSAGAAAVYIKNLTAGALAEAISFNFAIIKGSTT